MDGKASSRIVMSFLIHLLKKLTFYAGRIQLLETHEPVTSLAYLKIVLLLNDLHKQAIFINERVDNKGALY